MKPKPFIKSYFIGTMLFLTFFLIFPFIISAQLQVISNGNVGIGTSSPANLLHLYSTISAAGLLVDGTNAPAISLANSGTVKATLGMATASGDFVYDAVTNDLVFRLQDNGQHMLFNSNGGSNSTMCLYGNNVGIGITNPFVSLHVNAGGAPATSGNMNKGIAVSNGAGGCAINIGAFDNGSTQYGWLQAAYINNANVVRSLSLNPIGGNVGIGTTAPASAVEAMGNNSTSEVIQVSNAGSGGAVFTINGGAYGQVDNIGSGTDLYLTNSVSGGNMFLRTVNTTRMTITSSGNIGIGMTPGSYALDVNGSGRCSGMWISSDQIFKTQIVPISNALSIIEQLMPSSYYFDTINVYGMKFDHQKQYGLIAEDVEKILPELTSSTTKIATQDSSGRILTQAVTYKSLNYIAFIPLLVRGMQQQQLTIDSFAVVTARHDSINNARINALQSQIESCCSNNQPGMRLNSSSNSAGTVSNLGSPTAGSDLNTLSSSAATLYQNAPNPFSQQTSIGYFIPTGSQSASIMVFDLQGKLLKPISVTNYGGGAITINGSELSPGMYVYSLVVDGKIIDTKRMILTQ